MNSFEYLKTSPTRNMPWIRRGLRCNMDGRWGVVTAGSGGGIRVRFDGEKHSKPCHPHWQMTYYDQNGNIIKDYKQEG
jgi:hypothetical protein